MPLQEFERLERKNSIPDTVKTKGKDEVANWLDQNVFDKDRWPIPITQLVEEMKSDGVEYSRQHVSNTLQGYYKPVEEGSESIETAAENN